jgi:competence protein ComEC
MLLSIGAGQCAVVFPPPDSGASPWFIDAGSSTIADVDRLCVEPFFRSINCRHVDGMLLSHGDFDHISAAGDIAREYGLKHVVMSPHFRRHAEGVATAEDLLTTFDALGLTPEIISRGQYRQIAPGVSMRVLWPPVDCPLNSNTCGLVVRLCYGGRRILFPADIQEPAETDLLKHPEDLRADVLIAPHHGSAELTTGAFLAAVAPKFIVASNDRKLTHKQKLFDRLAGGYPLYRTSEYGAITIHVSRFGAVWATTFLQPAGELAAGR